MPHLRATMRFARGSRRRLVLTIVALASGVALICALDLVNRAVLRAFVEVVDTMAGRASLQVTVGEGGFFPEETVSRLAAIAGVENAVPVVTGTAFTVERPSQSLTVHAFELTDAAAVRVYQPDARGGVGIDDPLAFLNQPDSIVVTRTIAQRYGLTVESPLTLDTPSGRRVFVVRGVLEPRGIALAYGGNLLLMDLAAAQGVFARPGFVNRIDVVVQPSADVESVAAAIRTALPEGITVETPAQRKADLNAVMQSLRLLLQALAVIALAAAFMIAFNRVSAMFEDRAWQLGVMRALGVGRRVMWRELLKQGVLIGVAGVVVGVPLGIGLGRIILPVIAQTTALNYRVVAPDAELAIAWPSLMIAVILGLAAATLAAVLPAWRAAGGSIVTTMRGRGSEQGERTIESLQWVRGLLGVLIVSSVAVSFVRDEAIWGLVATVLLVIGTKMAARPLLEAVARPALTMLSRRGGPTLRFVVLSVMRKPRRTALTVAMVGIGLGAVFWLGFVAHSFEATTVRVFQHAMRSDLVVSATHVGAGELETPVDDRFADELRQVDGVESVVGVRLANWHFRGGPIVIDAFDPAYFTTPVFGEWPLLGAHAPDVWERVADGSGIVVSSNLVRNVGVGLDSTIELQTPNGPLPLRVVGITTDFASPRGTIEMSRALFARYWNDRRVTRFFVDTAAPVADHGTVRAAIADRLGAGDVGWRVISSGELVEHFAGQVRRAFASVYVLGAVILAVILFGITDNLSASVGERTRELGMLRALGLRRVVMWKLVVAEALLLSSLGLFLALVQGTLVGIVWIKRTIPSVLGWVIDLDVPIALTLGVVVLTTGLCALAALLPGRRAAALEPALAIRWE